MVYGRYKELDNYGIHGVFKPTYNCGAPSCMFIRFWPYLIGLVNPQKSPLLPSGKLTVCYWKWSFIFDLPIKNGDFP